MFLPFTKFIANFFLKKLGKQKRERKEKTRNKEREKKKLGKAAGC